MDIAQLRLDFAAIVARVPDPAVRAEFESRFEELAARHETASDKAAVEAEIEQLQEQAREAAAATASESQQAEPAPLARAAPLLIALGTLLFVVSLWGYFWGIGPNRYATIEYTRPVLVFTLIVAMLGFGGLLIFSSIFSSEPPEKFEKRFRHAREIFLVYAGIFGTIIGFYFGAADQEEAETPMSLEVAVAERSLSVEVTGGIGPFLGIFTRDAQSGGIVMASEDRVLSVNLDASGCPADATITVIDGRGQRESAEVDCPDEESADANQTNPAENAAGGNVDAGTGANLTDEGGAAPQ